MSKVEYFLVFESILYAAVITQLISGLARLYRDMGQYKMSWTHTLLSISLFLYIVQKYFAGQDFDQYDSVSMSGVFLIYLVLPPALWAFLIYLIFPKDNFEVDLDELLVRYRFEIFLIVLYPVVLTVNHNLRGTGYDLSNLLSWLPHATIMLLLLLFALTKRVGFALVYSILSITALIYFMFWVT